MAVTMSKKDQDALAAAGAKWNSAKTQAEKDAAHAEAEAIRAKYNYSGGADGSQHIAISKPSQDIKSTGGSSGGNSPYTGYTPTGAGDGTWRDAVGMTDADRAAMDRWGAAWNNAKTQAEKDYAHAQAEAIRSKYGYSGGTDGSEFNPIPDQTFGSFSYDAPPTYRDPYSDRIDQLLDQILNREGFTYDVSKDPLFAQYEDQYTREGQRAMKDTMGQMSARTGGLASSYAQTAAQQSNQYYMQQLADKVPELWQLAYEMYLDDIDLQVQDMGLLQDMSDTQYNRYRDTMNDWRNDRDFAYGAHRDDISDQRYDQEWQYQLGRDALEDQRYDQEWAYQKERDAIDDARYNREWAYKLEQDATGDGEDEDEITGTVETSGPSFDYDQDEGIFTFNGTAYNSIAALQAAIESTPMTDAEFDALLRKLALFGIPVTETE